MAPSLKAALEDLLRARRLQAESPPLRGERRLYPLGTGVATLDALLGGGFPRGQVSEVYGPSSSGRTGLLLSLVARVTRGGALGAWVDAADRLDPASALSAGVDLGRLLWLRGGRAVSESLSGAATLLGSGLFELVVLDLAGAPEKDVGRLPGTTWLRLQRMIEASTTAFVLLGNHHTAHGPAGVSLAMSPAKPFWSGHPGPGHLFQGLSTDVRVGRHGFRTTPLELPAAH
jgi:hypothetical protein